MREQELSTLVGKEARVAKSVAESQMKPPSSGSISSVVYVLPYLERGGTERHVLHLVRSFRHRARIGLLAPRGPSLQAFLELGVTYVEFPKLDRQLVRGIRQLRAGVRRLVQQLRPNVLHIHAAPELALLARGALRQDDLCSIVLTLHGFAVNNPQFNFKVANVLARLARIDRIITVSRAEREMLREAGFPTERSRLVYNGIPDAVQSDGVGGSDVEVDWRQRNGWPAGAPLIGAVGRLETVKGFDVLLDAFARLRVGAKTTASAPLASGPEGLRRGGDNMGTGSDAAPRLVIIGDGAEKESLRRQCVDLGVADRVHFAGYMPDAQRALRGFDMLVVPSRQEALSLAALEGMAGGLPVVASAVGGLPEVVTDGETGRLVPPDDPVALADAVQSLVDDPSRARKMGLRGRRKFEERFHVDRMAERTWALYEEVVR